MMVALLGVSVPGASAFGKGSSCPVPCHHGRCVELEVGVTYRCVCDDPDRDTMIGYSGASCDIPYTQCEDFERQCFNGAQCASSKKRPGKYVCDCSTAYSVSSFAGHQCQFSANEVCEFGTPVSDDAFCVNGGSCLRTVMPGEAHPGCDCPDEFEGSKCQYLKGEAPEGESSSRPRGIGIDNRGEQMNPGVVAVVVILCLMVGLVLAGVTYIHTSDDYDFDLKIASMDLKRARKGTDDDDDLVLEPDGTTTISPIKEEMREEAARQSANLSNVDIL